MLRREFLSVVVVLGGVAWTARAAADPKDLAVIVHPQNPITKIERGDLNAIFTTRMRSWDDGSKLIALQFPAREAHRVEFDRVVLGMEPDEASRYWIDRKIRGGNPPPKQVPSAKVMHGVVSRLKGAIGYIPATEVDTQVRVIARVRGGNLIGP